MDLGCVSLIVSYDLGLDLVDEYAAAFLNQGFQGCS